MKATRRVHRGAFTLIELLVVVAIIGILAAMLFPAVRQAIITAQSMATGNDGKQVWLGLFVGNQELQRAEQAELWPKDGDYSTSTEFFRACMASNWLDEEFTFQYMGAPGLPREKTANPDRFDAENNAWCVVLNLGPGTKGETPFMFTRNLAGGTTIDSISRIDETAKPFGSRVAVVVTFGGAIKTITAKDFQRGALQDMFNPTGATYPFIAP